MADEVEITLTIHGLDAYRHDVDGEVFAAKLTAFMKGLAAADEAANGKRRHKFLISDLSKNTASARIREQVVFDGPTAKSGLMFYEQALTAIRNKEEAAAFLPSALVKPIADLNKDASHSFDHGEVKTTLNRELLNVIIVDTFMSRRADSLLAEQKRRQEAEETYFKGSAYCSFDGVMKAVDLRGEAREAFLVLTTGNIQIACDVEDLELEKLQRSLDVRSVIYGMASYDGKSALPKKLKVQDIELVKQDGSLANWLGSFEIPSPITWDEE